MFSFTQWCDDFITKGHGHKYIKRVPYMSNGRRRYRYIYNVTHTHRGRNVMHTSDMVVGAKFMLDDTTGREVHAHIVSTAGGLVTIEYDDGPLKGKTKRIFPEALARQINTTHSAREKIREAEDKQRALLASMKRRGASEKQIASAQKRLDTLIGGEDFGAMSDEELLSHPDVKALLAVKDRIDYNNIVRDKRLPAVLHERLMGLLLNALKNKEPWANQMHIEARASILNWGQEHVREKDGGWYQEEIRDAQREERLAQKVPFVNMSTTDLDRNLVNSSYRGLTQSKEDQARRGDEEVDRFREDLDNIANTAQSAVEQGADEATVTRLASAHAQKVLALRENLARKRSLLTSTFYSGAGQFNHRRMEKLRGEYDRQQRGIATAVNNAKRALERLVQGGSAPSTPRDPQELTGVMGELATKLQGHEFTLSGGTKGRVEIDQDEGRVNLRFDGKPTAEERARLKASGASFKWSPSRGVWTRKLTRGGLDGAIRVSGLRFDEI